MTTAREVWSAVRKRSPEVRANLIPGLLKFLKGLDNPHAKKLTGQICNDPTTEHSAVQLTAWVTSRVASGKLTKPEAMEWLRLVHDAVVEYNRETSQLHPTLLAGITAPEPSPFAPQSMDDRRRVEIWRAALHDWIIHGTSNAYPAAWVAALTLSSVLNGMLLDKVKLEQLIQKLRQRSHPIIESGICHIPFDLPYQGLGNHHLQRWFIDPVSEMLVWRALDSGILLPEGSLLVHLRQFLRDQGVAQNKWPDSFTDFLDSARTWWLERASPIEVHCASRTLTTHAVHERSWQRMHGQTYAPRAARQRPPLNDQYSSGDRALELDDLSLVHPWLADSILALNTQDISSARVGIQSLLSANPAGGQPSLFLNWLLEMLNGFSAAKEALALSTIRRRYTAAAPRLLAILGDNNPANMTTLQLEDHYAELVTDLDPLAPIKDIASGLRDFHSYLHKVYRKPLMRKEAEVLGDENSLKPVDANLIDFDEYAKAQEYLDHERCGTAERKICKIVLMLAFKAGMRRMEIFGMQLRDIQMISRLTCVIRPNANRRLKTHSSQRIAPLQALLTRDERELLQQWLAQRISQVTSAQPGISQLDIDSHFVFDLFNSPRHETWVDRITDRVCAAIRSVTGDEGLFIHHLRHAFATWTYLRLRAPDFPNVANRFQHLRLTTHALKTGRRLRILLMGNPQAANRSYAFAVGRLLGHSSPTVSLGHYIHSEDILIGEVVRREIANIPKSVLLSASGLQKSAAYEQIANSVDALLKSCRKAHRPTTKDTNIELNVTKKRGRKSAPLAHQRADWIPLSITADILKLAINDKAPATEISDIVKIDTQKVYAIIQRAHALAGFIGTKTDPDGIFIEAPEIPKDKDAKALFAKLNVTLADLYFRAPVAYEQGTGIALNHFDTQKRDILFRGHKHLKEAKQFFSFLKLLSIPEQDFNWLIRRVDSNDETLPDWTKQINIDWSPHSIKVIRPKSASGSASYAQWAGVYPIDTDGESLGTAFIRSIFLSRVSNQPLDLLLTCQKNRAGKSPDP